MTIEHINQSIEKALRGESNLTEDILNIRGFSTKTMRHLFNNICNIDGKYLEVGLFCGATFCSSFNKNLYSIGVENYAQDFSVSTVKQELHDNLINNGTRAKEVRLVYEDCFSDECLKSVPRDIDIFCYDGEHSTENTAKALPHFLDRLSDKFIYIVDDTNWQQVFDGLNISFGQLKDKIEIEQVWPLRGYSLQDDPIWHNGVMVYLINKK